MNSFGIGMKQCAFLFGTGTRESDQGPPKIRILTFFLGSSAGFCSSIHRTRILVKSSETMQKTEQRAPRVFVADDKGIINLQRFS